MLALAEDVPTPPVFDADPNANKDDGKSGGAPRPRANLELAGKDEGERKFPKWLKLGPKASTSLPMTFASKVAILIAVLLLSQSSM